MGSYLSFDEGRNVLGLSVGPMLPLTLGDLSLLLQAEGFHHQICTC